MKTETSITPEKVISRVHKAAELLKTRGQRGLSILRDPTSAFNEDDAYLFIIDVENSLVVSNPVFPERNGGNIREHPDWSGKRYGIELYDVAMKGGGWIEFVWPKPGTDKGVRKIAYIYPVPGLRYTVCSGIYNDTLSIDSLNSLSVTSR